MKKQTEEKTLFNAYIGINLKNKLVLINKLNNLSMSEMVRRALEVYLIREEARIRVQNPKAFDEQPKGVIP